MKILYKALNPKLLLRFPSSTLIKNCCKLLLSNNICTNADGSCAGIPPCVSTEFVEAIFLLISGKLNTISSPELSELFLSTPSFKTIGLNDIISSFNFSIVGSSVVMSDSNNRVCTSNKYLSLVLLVSVTTVAMSNLL